jgi:hypothetical protein
VRSLVSNKRSTLLVVENATRATVGEQAVDALDDPESAEGSEDQRGNRDEARSSSAALVSVDTEEGPGDGDGASEVTFRRGEGVGGRGGLEDEEREEDEDLGPDASAVGEGVAAECLEAGQEDEDGGPTVIEGEGKVDEEFIAQVVGSVILLDDVIDMTDSRRDTEGENEGDDVVSTGPDAHVECVENCEDWETPSNTIDDDILSGIGELEDNVSEQQEVDKRPDQESPPSRGEIRFLGAVVDVSWTGNGVDVRSEEEEIHDNVYNLEEDTIFPSRGAVSGHVGRRVLRFELSRVVES